MFSSKLRLVALGLAALVLFASDAIAQPATVFLNYPTIAAWSDASPREVRPQPATVFLNHPTIALGPLNTVVFLNYPTIAAWSDASPRIKTLLKERYATLKKIEDEVTAMYRKGMASPSEVAEAKRAARNAELDLCETDKERVAVLEKKLAEAKDNEKLAEAGFHAAKLLHSAVLKATADRLEVEIALERAKSK